MSSSLRLRAAFERSLTTPRAVWNAVHEGRCGSSIVQAAQVQQKHCSRLVGSSSAHTASCSSMPLHCHYDLKQEGDKRKLQAASTALG